MESVRWPKGGLNLDDSVEVMDTDDWYYGLNIIQGRSTSSRNLEIEPIRSTILMALPSAIDSNSRFIGSVRAAKNDNFLFYYNSDPAKHCIIRHKDGVFTVVVQWQGLNFTNTKATRINGGGLAGDILYWTDDSNEPRCVNITRYLSTPPTTTEELLVIKRGPQIPPVFTKHTLGPALEALESNLINYFDFQFAYQYEYVDGQLSVLSPYSTLCAKSVNDEDYRRVRISIPVTENYPVLVKSVVVLARIGNNGAFFEIGRLKDSGSGIPRDFDFYNNTNGNVVETSFTKPFELVPRRAKTMALSKSRLWFGNYLEGYDTPTEVNISADYETSSTGDIGSTVAYDVFKIIKRINRFHFGSWNIISETEITNGGIPYFIRIVPEYATVDYNPGTYVAGVTVLNIVTNNIPDTFQTQTPIFPFNEGDEFTQYIFQPVVDDALIDVPLEIDDFQGKRTFPSASSYKLGVVFSDGQGRKSGVYTRDDLIVNTPQDFFSQIRINWSIADNVGIPYWAEYYSIVLSKNLKKSFFLEHATLGLHYSKTNTSGAEVKSTTYSTEMEYVKVNIRHLTAMGLGYSFQEGDRVLLRGVNSSDFDLQIKGFDGQYLLCETRSMGPLSETMSVSFEIYRPITTQYDIFFYEIGQVYKIIDGQYTVTEGTILGDCTNIIRSKYVLSGGEIAENGEDLYKVMSVTDGVWNTDAGRPFVEVGVGEVWKKQGLRYSSPFIAEAQVNGLSEFNTGDEGFVGVEAGEIQKLQPTISGVTEGDVLLAICTNHTQSVYVDESRLATGEGSLVFSSPKVIGDIRRQRTSFGTQHPESVMEEDGYVYWYDKLSRAYVRYASNGIHPISEYKAVDFFEKTSGVNSAADVVASGYDPFYKMVFVTFTNNHAAYHKTIGFSLTKERWISFYSFSPQGYFCDGEKMFSVNSSLVRAHNGTTYAVFDNGQLTAEIKLSFNDNPDVPKEWRVVQLQLSPNMFTYSGGDQVVNGDNLTVLVQNRKQQLSTILYNEFEVEEDMAYGIIRGDEFSTGGVLDGVPIYSNTLQVWIILRGVQYKSLAMVKAGFEASVGHTL